MEAAAFDRRVLIERGVVNAREIEVSVLGNDAPIASVCGEVLPSREFYSYEFKYIDGTSGLVIPAKIPQETSDRIRELAVRAYKAIDCAGMARVDFFLEKDTGTGAAQRAEHAARFYQHQHVPETVGGHRHFLS